MAASVQQEIIAIIAEKAVLRRDEVYLDQPLSALGIDSLGMVEAIFAIEELFDISVPFNANTGQSEDFDLSTVATVIASVEALVAGKSG
jgi:acyl carrier protein